MSVPCPIVLQIWVVQESNKESTVFVIQVIQRGVEMKAFGTLKSEC